MLLANGHGHISCTQGGESLAGLRAALQEGLVGKDETPVLDATAHQPEIYRVPEIDVLRLLPAGIRSDA